MEWASFPELIKEFKVIFLDSYGVLKNHRGVIPNAQKTIDLIRDLDIPFRVLTNDASRSPELLRVAFEEMGLQGIHTDEIITSGMMAKNYLIQKVTDGKIAYLGTTKAAEYIIEANLDTIPVSQVDLENLQEISAIVFLDDEGYDWNSDINKVVNMLRRENITAIVANSDQIYPTNKNDVSIATGGIAKLVEATLNRSFMHFGKPDSQMFMYAYEDVSGDSALERKDILMVGDTLHTDILGGNKFGVKTALVLSGNTRAANLETQVRATGIIPDFICESIGD